MTTVDPATVPSLAHGADPIARVVTGAADCGGSVAAQDRPPAGETGGSAWRDRPIGRLVRGTLGLTAGRGVASLVSAAWLVIAARRLPLSDFGDLALLLAVGGVFMAISDPGLQFVLAEHVARSGRIHLTVVHRVLARRLVAGLVCAAASGVLYLAAAHRVDPVIPLIFTASILCTAVYGSMLTAYRALGQVTYDAMNEIGSRLLVIGLGSWWLFHGGGLRAAVITYAAADAISAIVVYAVIRRSLVADRPSTVPVDLRLRSTAPLAFVTVTTIVYYKIDTYLVALLKGAAAAGLYGAAYRILEGALIPATTVASLMIAHTAGLGPETIVGTARRYVAVAVLFTVPVAAGGALASHLILGGLFGTTFDRATACAAVLLLSAIPSAAVAAYAPVAGLRNRAGFAFGAVIALVINASANLLVIPRFGLVGAAWVNVGSQGFLACWLARTVTTSARRTLRGTLEPKEAVT